MVKKQEKENNPQEGVKVLVMSWTSTLTCDMVSTCERDKHKPTWTHNYSCPEFLVSMRTTTPAPHGESVEMTTLFLTRLRCKAGIWIFHECATVVGLFHSDETCVPNWAVKNKWLAFSSLFTFLVLACELASSTCELASSTCELASSTCELASSTCELASSICELASSTCELASSTCELASSICELASSTCELAV